MDGMGRRGTRREQLLDYREKILDIEDEAIYRSLWRTRCGRDCGVVVRQTT